MLDTTFERNHIGIGGKIVANTYPYVASAGPLLKAVVHLRRSFPKEVTAETLRKLGVAPKNESYVINVLRFLGAIDDEGKKVPSKATAFVQHQDEAFAKEFSSVVRAAYEELFDLHGDGAWTLDRGTLTQFFRTTDHSSEVVGSRQASTFAALAALSGYADVPKARPQQGSSKAQVGTPPAKASGAKSGEKAVKAKPILEKNGGTSAPVGLTVRIEVNLPANGDQQTYDRIFRSIRANLIDGPA